MVSTREIFWNVGSVSVALMYLLALATVGVMVTGFRQRLALWRKGRALDLTDQPFRRFTRFMIDTFSQRKVTRVRDGGVPHALFFWAFLLLLAGTALVMVQADIVAPLFRTNLLSGEFYRIFSLVLDLAGLAAMLALAFLAVRRFIVRPPGLESSAEDAFIHLLLVAILATGFMIEGCRMSVTELRDQPELAAWSPVGALVAAMFTSMDASAARVLHKGLWWIHLLLGLGFLALIPRTKLRHLATASANSFFEPHEPKGSLSPVDLDDESVQRFGVSAVEELSWKALFDTDACMQCARCQQRCPAFLTGKPLSPMVVLRQTKNLAESSAGKSLVETVSRQAIWSCTTCAACEEICPAGIEHVGRIIDMRRYLTLMEGEFPGSAARRACEAIEINGNPFGLSQASRGDWAKGLPVIVADGKSEVDILYFTGCYASYDPRNRQVAASFVRICTAAGLRVGILGGAEGCCGEPARKLGNEYLYRMTAERNIAAFRAGRVRRIVTACPHCFSTLGYDYRQMGFDVPVEHHAVFIGRLLEEGRLKLKEAPFMTAFHDSCYLARYRDIVDEPRNLLKAAGGTIREMERSGKEGFCCGGGGGGIFADEKAGVRTIVSERIGMARNSGAATLTTACPFCMSMFEAGLKRSGDGAGLDVLDLAEIVAGRIDPGRTAEGFHSKPKR